MASLLRTNLAFAVYNTDNISLQPLVHVKIRAECGEFAGNGPDHQYPFLDGAGNEIVVRVVAKRGLGNGLAVEFHSSTIPCCGPWGKPRAIL